MDRSALGKQGEPFVFDVERGKVREFARAVRAEHADYVGEAPVVPPTFLTAMMHWEPDVAGANPWHALHVDQQRGLHAEQEYLFFGPPPRAGTQLICRSRIERVYDKPGRRGGTLEFAVMVTEYRDVSGKLVAEARLTGVETARNPEHA